MKTVTISSRWEPIVDHVLIDNLDGTDLRLHQPIPREVVFVADQPWENASSGYYTVFHDGRRVRLYYRGFMDPEKKRPEAQLTCMAESRDGVHFERPRLGLFDFAGSTANNIVWRGEEAHCFAPFLDANPEAKPAQRFKALGRKRIGGKSALMALASRDGVIWHYLDPEPVIADGAFDSLNIAFWDTFTQQYRCFSRYFDRGEQAAAVGREKARAIQSAVSSDFLNWSSQTPHRYAPGTPVDEFYTNATVPCPGAEHILLSFPKRFFAERAKYERDLARGISDAAFMTSRDGIFWDRTFSQAWIRPGLDQKNWTDRNMMPAWGLLELTPGEFSIYVSEHYRWPDNRLRRYTVRRHGFASIHADRPGGTWVTPPLQPAGHCLQLNYASSAGGSVRVSVLDAAGQPIPGWTAADMPQPLYGDELDAVVCWNDHNELPQTEQPIRLQFQLDDADVYALRTTERTAAETRFR